MLERSLDRAVLRLGHLRGIPAGFGVDTAKEQYCDPAEYYQGGHAQCYRQIQHHYYSDVHALRLA